MVLLQLHQDQTLNKDYVNLEATIEVIVCIKQKLSP